MTATMRACLRALRDCGVVRCRPGHPGYGSLAAGGYATALRRQVADGHALDFRLTDAGVAEAALLPVLKGGTRPC